MKSITTAKWFDHSNCNLSLKQLTGHPGKVVAQTTECGPYCSFMLMIFQRQAEASMEIH